MSSTQVQMQYNDSAGHQHCLRQYGSPDQSEHRAFVMAETTIPTNRTLRGLRHLYRHEWFIWKQARQRCFNKNRRDYHHYGGRGITMVPEWSTFKQFIADMGARPDKSLTLDRIDNDGHYCAANCKWSTRDEQRRNQRPRAIRTHCKHGHELTDENVYLRTKREIAYRCCRQCNREYKRDRRKRAS